MTAPELVDTARPPPLAAAAETTTAVHVEVPSAAVDVSADPLEQVVVVRLTLTVEPNAESPVPAVLKNVAHVPTPTDEIAVTTCPVEHVVVVMFSAIVPLTVIVPPLRPAPATMEVTVPLPPEPPPPPSFVGGTTPPPGRVTCASAGEHRTATRTSRRSARAVTDTPRPARTSRPARPH